VRCDDVGEGLASAVPGNVANRALASKVLLRENELPITRIDENRAKNLAVLGPIIIGDENIGLVWRGDKADLREPVSSA
jgi:hypothetical protein